MVPQFERCTAAVEPGELTPLCETPFGFHVIRRDAIIEARARHLVVYHQHSHRGGHERSLEEARARVAEAQRALAGGMRFEEAARIWSDDSTAAQGGALGLVAPGQMVPAFDDALFALEVDEVSPPVETPYGVHLIQRLAP